MTRPAAAAIIRGLVVLAYGLMWKGWRGRNRAEQEVPSPLTLLPDSPDVEGPFEARYLGSTYAGAWLARIVAHSQARRARVRVSGSIAVDTVVRPHPTDRERVLAAVRQRAGVRQ